MRRDLVVVYAGHLLADGGQGYSRRIDAENGAKRVTGHRLRRRVKFVTGPDADPITLGGTHGAR